MTIDRTSKHIRVSWYLIGGSIENRISIAFSINHVFVYKPITIFEISMLHLGAFSLYVNILNTSFSIAVYKGKSRKDSK